MEQAYNGLPKSGWGQVRLPRAGLKAGACILALAAAVFACVRVAGLYSQRKEEAARTYFLEVTNRVYAAVTSYTRACDNIAANSDVTSYAAAPSNSAAAVRMRTSLEQLTNTFALETNRLMVYFPDSGSAITATQWYNSVSDSFFTLRYDGLLNPDVLAAMEDDETWQTFCGEDSAWLVRKAKDPNTEAVVAYIILELDLAKIVPNVLPDEITVIGDADTCLFSNIGEISAGDYAALLQSTVSGRSFLHGRTRYLATKCKFSAVDLNIIVGIPEAAAMRSLMGNATLPILAAAAVLAGIAGLAVYFGRKRRALPAAPAPAQAEEGIAENFRFLVPLGIGELLKRLGSAPPGEAKILACQIMEMAGLREDAPFFVTILYIVKDEHGLFEPLRDGKAEDRSQWISSYWVLENMLNDVLFDKHAGTIAVVDNSYFVIAQQNGDEDFEKLQETFGNVSRIYEKIFRVDLDCIGPACGKGTDELTGIVQRQAAEISTKRFWQQAHTENGAEGAHDFKSYLLAIQSAFDKISSMDYVSALEIIHKIIDEELPSGPENLRIAQSRASVLVDMLTTAVGEQTAVHVCPYLKDRLHSAHNIAELRETIEQIFMKMIRLKEDAKDTPSGRRVEEIKAYIHAHIGESTLNVTAISEQFNTSASYLSRIFKENTGSSVLEYIQKLRVSNAKEFLARCSVKESAAMAGFWDTQGFIRTFKKYEGITPGEYKQRLGRP